MEANPPARPAYSRPLVSLVGLGLLGLIAALFPGCGSEDTVGPAPPPPPEPARPASVSVTPATAVLSALGDTVRLQAEVRDQNRQVMAGAAVSWASGDASVAAVDASGLVTAAGDGTTTITAMAGSASGTAMVTVAQQVSAVAVAPAAAALVAGDTLRLAALATDANGHPVAGAEFSWSSSDSAVAAVAASGLVRAISEGTATVTAALGSAEGMAEIVVEADPDREALAALYEATSGPNWINKSNWLTDRPLSEWYGVEVGSDGNVSRLRLRANGLTGRIPPQLGLLQSVSVLDLRDNRATAASRLDPGSDPAPDLVELPTPASSAAGEPARSRTGRRTGGLDGPIPAELGNLANLELLSLGGNNLNGTIPPELGDLANLKWLFLGDNKLSGRIPATMKDLVSLTALYLNDNDLTGPIPPELENLANLETLALWQNDLTGSIPPELGNLASLEGLYLTDNDLGGPIPAELGSLPNLRHLFLWGNRLSGPIPPELGNLGSLTDLRLRDNSLGGPIPPELGNLANLNYLSLTRNRLSGAVPAELGNLGNLTTLALGGNELDGGIPPALGGLVTLQLMYLWGNNLSGSIPPELGNLSALRVLLLSSNELRGPIPESFLELQALERLWFAGNADLCAPGTTGFVAWLGGIEEVSGPYCNESDMVVLEHLYETSGGPDWTNSAGWLETPALEEWYGVTVNSLGRVVVLDLAGNGLTGELKADLGRLGDLTGLRIGDNALTGLLPLSLADLPPLDELHYAGTGLCAPSELRSWLDGIPSHEGSDMECGPLSDREVLVSLYVTMDGRNWEEADNWLTDAPLGDWHGVETDGFGRVVELDLSSNGLTGPIPPELSDLVALESLSLSANELSGTIPAELGQLPALEHLRLGAKIFPTHRLTGPIPPELGNLETLRSLWLDGHSLTGPVPAELGDLANLVALHLSDNNLSGRIPPELANLTNLGLLNLRDNRLTGSIPPELGDLASLLGLWLSNNRLQGPIPPEMASLPSLRFLYLDSNRLTGPIPPELGNLSKLERLILGANNLTGPMPAELGAMAALRELAVANNTGLSGPLPAALTALGRLEALVTGGTDLCAPAEPAFRSWLQGVHKRRIRTCEEGDPPAAYLVQAVQSREFPVPLVAGRKALLRVFPTAPDTTSARMPTVRARFYVDGQETHMVNIPGRSTSIPTEVDEGRWSRSSNVEIPGSVVQPGLEMVVEIDPSGRLDPSLGVARRIPETGRLAVEVHAVPPLDLTLVPFIWRGTHDSSIVGLVRAMAADPEGHEMLSDTRALLPVGDLEVRAHAPVLTSTNNAFDLLAQTRAIRIMEGGTGHYKGMMFPPVTGAGGVAIRPGRSSFSQPYHDVLAHELGHNLGLLHAPCGDPSNVDSSFPYPDGSIGAWGYDFRRLGGGLVRPSMPDLMTYCGPPDGVSDFHFSNALRFRVSEADSAGLPDRVPLTRSLLLWGGVDSEGSPFLEPAFVVEAAPALPDSAGDYMIAGRAADGGELFSLSFAMPETADGDGSSGLVFALPVRPGWDEDLATITLTGPGGSVTLDGESEIPMAIMRDPRSGQVRGILREPRGTLGTLAEAVAALSPDPGLEVLFSRGIPDAAAWGRRERR